MIEILECGRLNSVQDLGRFGLRSIGIGTAGAMDSMALRAGNILAGNILAGNVEDLAGIEVQTFPFALRFHQDVRFAVTGADSPAFLDETPLPPWWSMGAREGQVLRLLAPRSGARSYITLAGGVETAPTMGSRSTDMRNSFGGFDGRALEKGDRLSLAGKVDIDEQGIGANVPPALVAPEKPLPIRVVPGAEYDLLPPTLQDSFWATDWMVTAQSNRNGYRLRGAELRLPAPMEMRSYGVVAGIIQLPPSGQPIIQLSDANTAGGYPRLGGVIEADLHRLGQVPPGASIRFIRSDFIAAQAAQQRIEDFLSDLRGAVEAIRNHQPQG